METNLPESINDNYLVEYYNYRDVDKSSNLYHFHRGPFRIQACHKKSLDWFWRYACL